MVARRDKAVVQTQQKRAASEQQETSTASSKRAQKAAPYAPQGSGRGRKIRQSSTSKMLGSTSYTDDYETQHNTMEYDDIGTLANANKGNKDTTNTLTRDDDEYDDEVDEGC